MSVDRIIADALMDALAEQPWYRRYSNTVTAFASATVTLGTWAAATWTDLHPHRATVLGVVVMVAGVIAQRATQNGLTPRSDVTVLDALTGVGEQIEAQARRGVELPADLTAKLDEIIGHVNPVTPHLGGVGVNEEMGAAVKRAAAASREALRRNQVAVRKAAGRHRDADDTAPIPPLSSTDAWEQR